MTKIEIILSWDGIMNQSQFASACSDTIKHGIISDKSTEWKGIVCSPFSGSDVISNDKQWTFNKYGDSAEYFGWLNAIKSSSADWVLITYPGVALHIDSLIDSLEFSANKNDPVCFCAGINYDLDDEICDIIREKNDKVVDIKNLMPHEWGSFAISKGAVKKFVENKDAMGYLASRSGSPLRFDHISALIRNAAKLPLTPLQSMSSYRSSDSFRGIHRMGKYSLIHYVGDWMDEGGWHDYLRARLFASSMDGLKDGEFGADLSMPDIKSDVILLLSEPGNIDRIKWLQKSCQQHIRPVPSIVVMLQESARGKYHGNDYEKTVDYCASTRTGLLRMRQNSSWTNDHLIIKACVHLFSKNVKKIFASSGDCYLLNDPFKSIDEGKGITYFSDNGAPCVDAFGISVKPKEMEDIAKNMGIWEDHNSAISDSKIYTKFIDSLKMMRREDYFWKTMTKENVFKMAREGKVIAAIGESACRHLISNI